MATLVGDMDEDITLIVVGPWELQHPRRRHLSSSEQTEPSVDEDSITVSHGLCALNFLRHCRRQHEEKAAASQETRSRAARLTPSQIQNRAIYPRWLGSWAGLGRHLQTPSSAAICNPPKLQHCWQERRTSTGRIALSIHSRYGASARLHA